MRRRQFFGLASVLAMGGAACSSSSSGDLFPSTADVGSDAGVDATAPPSPSGSSTSPTPQPDGATPADSAPPSCGAPDDPKTGCGVSPCTPCAIKNGSARCDNRRCAVLACNAGHADCNGDPHDGCEVDITSDPAHCGGCTVACGATQVCGPTGCTATCPGTLENCSGACVDTTSNAEHCGSCTTPCTPVANGVALCQNKTCGFSCNAGYAPCTGGSGCCLVPPPDAGGGGACDATTSCTSNVAMGAVRGDIGADSVTANGTISEWLRITVTEADSSFPLHDLKFTATVVSPPGMDFELYGYLSPCGSGLYGNGHTVTGGWPDQLGTDESRDVILEVRYTSGGACGAAWSLTVNGNQ